MSPQKNSKTTSPSKRTHTEMITTDITCNKSDFTVSEDLSQGSSELFHSPTPTPNKISQSPNKKIKPMLMSVRDTSLQESSYSQEKYHKLMQFFQGFREGHVCSTILSEKYRNNTFMMSELVKICPLYLKLGTSAVKNNRDIVSQAVRIMGSSIRFASKELKCDPDIVKLAVQNDGCALQFIPESILNLHPEICKIALENTYAALEFLPFSMTSDSEFIKNCLNNSLNKESMYLTKQILTGYKSLDTLTEDQKKDCNLFNELVKQSLFNLQYAHESVRDNEFVVRTAVSYHGSAIQFASDRLRANKHIAFMAVENDGFAIEWVCPSILEQNKDICITALTQTPFVSEFIPEKFTKNPSFLKCIFKKTNLNLSFWNHLPNIPKLNLSDSGNSISYNKSSR